MSKMLLLAFGAVLATASPPAFPPDDLCAHYCRAKGYGCNDFRVGANRRLSCAQACHMRLKLKIGQYKCREYCQTATFWRPGLAPDACNLVVAGHEYHMCSSACGRHVFVRESVWGEEKCTEGVCGSEPCLDGCAIMSDELNVLLETYYGADDNGTTATKKNASEVASSWEIIQDPNPCVFKWHAWQFMTVSLLIMSAVYLIIYVAFRRYISFQYRKLQRERELRRIGSSASRDTIASLEDWTPRLDEIADFVAEFNGSFSAETAADDDQDAAMIERFLLKKHPEALTCLGIVEPVVGLIDGKKIKQAWSDACPPASKGGVIPEDSATHSYLRDGGIMQDFGSDHDIEAGSETDVGKRSAYSVATPAGELLGADAGFETVYYLSDRVCVCTGEPAKQN
eukprot:g1918.t1